MTKFTIIIPVYNAEKYLKMALDSVLAQSFQDWECICIDDGSKDGSANILDSYALSDERFKIIHQDNGGEGAARNAGLKIAKGEWITCLDADDMYTPDRLMTFNDLIMAENPDLVRCCFSFIGENDCNTLPNNEARDYEVILGLEAQKWGWDVLMTRGLACTWTVKRELLNGILFRTDMRVKVDGIFCGRMANRLHKVVSCNYPSYFYRQVSTSAMHCKHTVSDVVNMFTAIEDLWRKENHVEALRETMQIRFRSHCESEIIDWLGSGSDTTRSNVLNIHSLYVEMIKKGIFSKTCHAKTIWYFPLLLFYYLKIVFPVIAVSNLINLKRRIK